ncbi:MAG: TM0996/MTH895 family glutaredoxin-like protein [Deltaproteobacteria bacterium]|jgi:small redox-active disulfide protein 2|nr:TM0996/MTH895 family glutaredoxin-like protein [Deltaproteobacteria bacterium]MBN2846715.1 TM0996/MTH895 family glutaredoxin-like protein [Deltaproteobacteria bacterium]
MEIKILGPGCMKCRKTEDLVKEIVVESGVAATIDKVTDIMKITDYGVMSTPAVIVDGEVVSVGKVPTKEEIKKWITK